MVPLEDGTLAAIEHLPVTTPTKTLGQMTCLTGSSDGAITQMKEKVQGWIAKAQSSKLHKCNLWFLLDKQFWPWVSFEISSICAPFAVLEECLMQTYFDMLSFCGIRKLVSKDIWHIGRGFYGVGPPHRGVECFVTQINKLLMHYGSSSGLRIHMKVSMELMVIKGGVSTQILSQPFLRFSKWVMHCWLWLVWEKVDLFQVHVEVSELPLAFPCERDNWLMLVFVSMGFTDDELIYLNRV
jgi:hypothetical protein